MSIALCKYCLPVLGKFTFSPRHQCERCGSRRPTTIYDGVMPKAKLPRMSAVDLWDACSGADDAPVMGRDVAYALTH